MSEFDIATLTAHFHWLRPLWLLGIPLVMLAGVYLWRGRVRHSQWQQLINPQLLPHLLQGKLSRQQRWPLAALLSALIIALVAMAGPSWEKLPQPIHKTNNALVILYDMSPSMLAEDLKPSRLVRSRLKLVDLLQQRKEGLTALIAYAGEAHTVTPLTDDTETISSLLPALSPTVMPVSGSNTEMALDLAVKLFKDSGVTEGDILLVTDEVTVDAQQYLRRKLPLGFHLSILGVGSEAGAPIPARHGGFIRDKNNGIVLAKLNVSELSELASKSGGSYRTLSHDDSDIRALLPRADLLGGDTRELEREFDTWLDRGAWLVLLLIPFAAFSFRRGWLLVLPLMFCLPEPSYAFGWQDLWQTRDQQGMELLQQNQASEAASTFNNPDWKATAHYRAGNYAAAAEAFADQQSASGYYNAGNALAKAGQLQAALNAYDQALKLQPEMADARANRELVEQLLQQQNQDQQQDPNQQQNDSGQNEQQDDPSGNNGQDSPEQNAGEDSANNQESENQDSGNSGEGSQPQDADGNAGSEGNQGKQSGNGEQPAGDPHQGDDNNLAAAEDAENQRDGEPAQQTEATQAGDQHANTDAGAESGAPREAQLSDEEQQAMEQWLRQIPDDPSGLMRRKFEHQYRQRLLESQRGYWQPPGNQNQERW